MRNVTVSFSGANDEEIAVAAAAGDRDAAEEYFARNISLLAGMARRLGGTVVDPDDLLSTAITALLTRWHAGSGPRENLNGYLIQSMRNRVVDEIRSPRSKQVSIEKTDEPAVEDAAAYERIDVHHESGLVVKALATLPQDQRSVLVGTVIEGRKSGEIAESLGRPASVVYSLVNRARLSLRRALLSEYIKENAPPECAKAARQLPKLVPEDVDLAPESRGMKHIRTCKRCRASWAKFGTLGSALGLSTTIVIANIGAPTQAFAATIDPTDFDRSDQNASDSPTSNGTSLGSVTPLPRAPLTEPDDASPDPPRRNRADTQKAVSSPASATSVAKKALVIVGAASFALGAAIMAVVLMIAAGWLPNLTPEPEGDLNVVPVAGPPGYVGLNVQFTVDRAEWLIDDLVIHVPPGIENVTAPTGWTCEKASEFVRCVTEQPNATGGTFLLGGNVDAGGRYTLSIAAHADGVEFTGDAEGPLAVR
jgi:RNA polymerase sigma factor (sigma-70 family)